MDSIPKFVYVWMPSSILLLDLVLVDGEEVFLLERFLVNNRNFLELIFCKDLFDHAPQHLHRARAVQNVVVIEPGPKNA